jgi:hypothetical protein
MLLTKIAETCKIAGSQVSIYHRVESSFGFPAFPYPTPRPTLSGTGLGRWAPQPGSFLLGKGDGAVQQVPALPEFEKLVTAGQGDLDHPALLLLVEGPGQPGPEPDRSDAASSLEGYCRAFAEHEWHRK